MAQLLVRNLPEDVKNGLRVRAAQHHRSMEAEARAILVEAIAPQADDPVLTWLDDAARLRAEIGGVDLPMPQRRASRPVEPW